ncbi:uncharacterized protein LOC119683891 [Teleopsis dalmanni]|uniref:uncharacterized protein LOC119683891 n=1 Tax=Teleopsis dalmanni TaxID=139649 RepID=UPI0018CD1207|nr:uncharacterized protein LOC119683891 [Teleopsis dalmanni]
MANTKRAKKTATAVPAKREEFKFAKNVAGKEGSPAFNKHLELLLKEEKLKTLKEQGVKFHYMTSILDKSYGNAPNAFSELYDLWVDDTGKKTQYLITLEKNNINFPNMSSILCGSGDTLERQVISLLSMTGILSKSGINAAKAYKDLYDLWFDRHGNKTRYMKTLE